LRSAGPMLSGPVYWLYAADAESEPVILLTQS
jgi:hypothetical protein